MNSKKINHSRKLKDFSIGDHIIFTRVWGMDAFKEFRQISGDNNPLHHDESYASKTSFGKPIVPLHLATSPLSAIAGMMIPGDNSLYLTNHVRAIEAIPYGEKITYSAKVVAIIEVRQALELRVLLLDKDKVLVEASMVVQVRDDYDSTLASLNYNQFNDIYNTPPQTILVTGALGGIGRSVCRSLAEKGVSILIQHRVGREKEAENLAEKCRKFNVRVASIGSELEDQKSIKIMMQKLLKKETITGLIHLASPAVDASMMQNMAVNYQSLVTMLEILTPVWLSHQYGRVIVVGSSAVEYFPQGWENYVAAKVTASRYILAWHSRHAQYDIEGRVVSPGYVQTSFSDELREDGVDALLPEQVAEVIADSILEKNGSENPYLWLETSGLRRGSWGFFLKLDQSRSSANIKKPKPFQDLSNDSKESIEFLIRDFFGLGEDVSLEGAGINLLPGWDSLKHIELMLFLEKKLGISFRSDEIEATKMLSDLKQLIFKKISSTLK